MINQTHTYATLEVPQDTFSNVKEALIQAGVLNDYFDEDEGLLVMTGIALKPSSESPHHVLTCVYCGQEYPIGTPASGSEVLTAHIKVCEKHPMTRLRRALVGLVGEDTKEGLEQLKAVIPMVPGEDENKAVTLTAIDALLATI